MSLNSPTEIIFYYKTNNYIKSSVIDSKSFEWFYIITLSEIPLQYSTKLFIIQ